MADLEATFRSFADWAHGSDPLYAHLARRVAADADPDLLAVAESAPADRATANLLFAAVHYRLANSPDHPLAAYYPSLVDDPRAPDEDCYPAFRAFCLDHADAVRSLLRTRRTQTNSVRRCAVLFPAIAHVAARVDGPLALVELGPSAGLNLLFDRYRYDYGDRVVGAAGDPPLPATPPSTHSRVGIDLHPLDVTDNADTDWLRALVWPAHEERRAVLDDALAVARTTPPRLVEGDLLADLPAVLDGIPDDVPVCVLNTLVLYQVPEAVCTELAALLTERMAENERPLHWLTGETELSGGESVRLDWVHAEGGVERRRLAEYDPHGAWIDWRL